MTRRISIFICFWCFLGIAGLGFGQDNYGRIARLSYLDGNVSFQHTGDSDWSDVSINMPLQQGDRIYTGPQGRAEIQFDEGSVCRLAENTDAEILSLEENLIQLRILVGLSTLTVASNLDFEVGTPAAAFNTLSKGVYRFDVVESGNTDGIVRSGSMEAANDQFSRQLRSGDLIHLIPGATGVQTASRYLTRDAWDEWTDRRTADLRAYNSAKYLPDYARIGAAELDRHGRWVNVDTYGAAWIPSYLTAEWTPYSMGRWVYRPFWGWTWVSYEPWGWLPYHYGRWHHHSQFGWCWLPGAAVSFNFWSPALVSFYQGPGWISWCPLGPGDYYNSNRYFFGRGFQDRLNEVRMAQHRAPGDLINRGVPGAFRTVQTDRFVNANFGARGTRIPEMRVDQPWEKGRLITDQPDLRPAGRGPAPGSGGGISRPSSNPPTVVRSEPASGMRDRMTKISNPKIQPVVREAGAPRNDNGTAGGNAPVMNRGSASGERVNPGGRQPQEIPGPAGTSRPDVINPGVQNGRGTVTVPRGQTTQSPKSTQVSPSTSVPERNAPARATEPQMNPARRQQTAPATGGSMNGGTAPARVAPKAAPTPRAVPSPNQGKVTLAPVNKAPATDAKPGNEQRPGGEKTRQPQELQRSTNFANSSSYGGVAGNRTMGNPSVSELGRVQQSNSANMGQVRNTPAPSHESTPTSGAARQNSLSGANSRTAPGIGFSGSSSVSAPGPVQKSNSANIGQTRSMTAPNSGSTPMGGAARQNSMSGAGSRAGGIKGSSGSSPASAPASGGRKGR